MTQAIVKSPIDEVFELPLVVRKILRAGGLLVGGRAYAYVWAQRGYEGDYDILVPFEYWHEATKYIPRNAYTNGFRGWRFTTNNDQVEVDIWPGDLLAFLRQSVKDTGNTSYAVDFTGLVIEAERKAVHP